MSEADAIEAAGPGFARAGRLQIPEDLPHINLRDAQLAGVDHLDIPLAGLKDFSVELAFTKPGDLLGSRLVASWTDEWHAHKRARIRRMHQLYRRRNR